MSKTEIKLAPAALTAATSTQVMKDLGEIPMFDHTKTVDKMASDSRDTFDGYEFHTDWNGSTNYMRTNNGNPFATNYDDGLRFYTSDKIGKDRRLYYQWWGRGTDNLWLPNVIGYTGLWNHTDRQYHPRLQMVVFHYMDANGNRTHDYKVDQNLRSYNSGSHYWAYDEGGQHDSGIDWWIGYQLSESRRRTICNEGHLLFGMSMSILFRTAASSDWPNCRYYGFKPIIGSGGSGASLKNLNDCRTGKRLVIPPYGNTYPKGSSEYKLF